MEGSRHELTSEQIRQEIDKNLQLLAKIKYENEQYTKEHTKIIRKYTLDISKTKKELTTLELELENLPSTSENQAQILSVQSNIQSTTTKLANLRDSREEKLETYKQKKQELQNQEDELQATIDLLEKSERDAIEREKASDHEREAQEAEAQRQRELQDLIIQRNRERVLSARQTSNQTPPVPNQTLPNQTLPKQTAPKQTAPKQTTPKQTTPETEPVTSKQIVPEKRITEPVTSKQIVSEKRITKPVTSTQSKLAPEVPDQEVPESIKPYKPKTTSEPVSRQIVDEKLVDKSKKAHELLAKARTIKAMADEAEAEARVERQEAGEDVAKAGAKVLEAVDTAEVVRKRLSETKSKGVGARVDAVRATTGVEVAETEFKHKEFKYKEKQVDVAKLSVKSDILDLKAEIKELEAETVDLSIAKSQLHGIGMEYKAKMEKENPTDEELQDRETLEVLFEGLKSSIARQEAKMEQRAGRIKLKEASLTEEALDELNRDIQADEEEYLDLAKSVRTSIENTYEAMEEAQEQESKLVEQLEYETNSPESFLGAHTDSKLLSGLKEAQAVKKEVLKVGSELFEKRIEEAEENLEVNVLKGQDTVLSEQTLAELTEIRNKMKSSKAVLSTVATMSRVGAESVKAVGYATGLATDMITEAVGVSTDLTAEISRVIPYAGEVLHVGLHVAAGIARITGHVLSGLERSTGETLRGEILINTEGTTAEATMGVEATQLGLTDTQGLARASGQRHGEVERGIAFDRVGHVLAETGEQVVDDILNVLKNIGVEVPDQSTLVGDEGLGNLFLQGMDENNIFDSYGDLGIGLRGSLGAFFEGGDISSYLDTLGEGTALRAGVEGFMGGLISGLDKAGIGLGEMSGEITSNLTNALKASKDAVKVKGVHLGDPQAENSTADFLGHTEATPSKEYTQWFDADGDKAEAQRIVSQKSPNIESSLYRPEVDEEGGYDVGDEDSEGEEDSEESSGTSLGGSSEDESWKRTPYGSLIRGENRTKAEGNKVLSALKSRTKQLGSKAKDVLSKFKKKKKKQRRRIILIIIALILLVAVFVQMVLFPAVVGVLGGIINFHNHGHWGGNECDCGCLEQFYGEDYGGTVGTGGPELGEGMISGTLDDGGIITYNVPSEIIMTRNGVDTPMNPQNNWQVYMHGDSYSGPYGQPNKDEDGLLYGIVGSKLVNIDTPDDSFILSSSIYGGKDRIYGRLLMEVDGELKAKIFRVSHLDAKAHTFNRYPEYPWVVRKGIGDGSIPYVIQRFKDAQNRVWGDRNFAADKDDVVRYNIPSGILQTGIAYPHSVNALGNVASDAPWMSKHNDLSSVEWHRSGGLAEMRAEFPGAKLIQIHTSTDRAKLESLAIVAPTDPSQGGFYPPDEAEEITEPEDDEDADDTDDTDDTDEETEEADEEADEETDEAEETDDTAKNTTAGTSTESTIVCDCPLDCSCWDIHGRGPNIVRSDGTPVFGEGGESSEDLYWQSTGEYVMAEDSLRVKMEGMDNAAKDKFLYGKTWSSSADTKPFLRNVKIPVWLYEGEKGGAKKAGERYLDVHEAIADELLSIYTEIFNDPEQFVIYEVGGFRAGTDYMHPRGLAIDMNVKENPMKSRGVGSYWAPIGVPESEWVISSGTPPAGGDPLSFPINGSVVRIFKKYGWCWGGDAVVGTNWAGDASHWRTSTDFMHFSVCGWGVH